MPRNPVPRDTDSSRLHHLQDLTTSIRHNAVELDESATQALFSAFPLIRDRATRDVATRLVQLRLAMADVERVLLARDVAAH